MKLKIEIRSLLVLVFLSEIALGQSSVGPGGSPKPTLPAPSGSYALGRQAFHWIDPARVDEFSSAPGNHRELMVYIWYPAQPSRGTTPAEYFPGASVIAKNPSTERAARDMFGPAWSQIAAGTLRSHAIANALPVTNRGGFPVVLFSHGSSSTGFGYTAQIENLVSHGYVVVAIEHPGLAGLVRFSDGHIRLFQVSPSSPAASKDPMRAAVNSAEERTQTGAEDVKFVLDTLARKQNALVSVMNLNRVAAIGHSAGGTVTARACQMERRIKACISEDGEVNPVGVFFDYPDHARMTQPFLLIEIDEQHTDQELARMGESRAQWNDYLAHAREQLNSCAAGSYHVVLSIPSLVHSSFSDGLLINSPPVSAEASSALSNLELTELLELGFLDSALKVDNAPPFNRVAKSSADIKVTPIGQ